MGLLTFEKALHVEIRDDFLAGLLFERKRPKGVKTHFEGRVATVAKKFRTVIFRFLTTF